MFEGRKLLIATKHEKEKVMSPILEQVLGVNCFTIDHFDTDELGTFTGEVERTGDALETAKNKCLKAIALSGCDMAIASEGSFGPHPNNYFIQSDDEILFFIDQKNELEIFTRLITTETNFNASEISHKQQLKDFAYSVGFPSHGLIIKKAKNDFSEIEKGIINWKKLSDTFDRMVKVNGSVYVETDMRAMFNPSRMKVIEAGTKRLVAKITSCCPVCNWPGFAITTVKDGLPCDLCTFPTRSVLSYIYVCHKCNFEKEEMFPNEKKTEDPMYCDRCNP